MDTEIASMLFKKDWVIYAKRPFNGAQGVIEYLGRYTHKIAISNHRIKDTSGNKVTFTYKDYRQNAVTREMTLDSFEFIRRFSMHILSKGFVRIRHYGILSSTAKVSSIAQIKRQLPEMSIPKPVGSLAEAYNPKTCPCCKKDTMMTILRFNRRGPPEDWQLLAQKVLACLV